MSVFYSSTIYLNYISFTTYSTEIAKISSPDSKKKGKKPLVKEQAGKPTDITKIKLKKVVHKESSPEEETPKERVATPEPTDTSEVSVPEHGKLTELETYEPSHIESCPTEEMPSEGELDTVQKSTKDSVSLKKKKPAKKTPVKSKEPEPESELTVVKMETAGISADDVSTKVPASPEIAPEETVIPLTPDQAVLSPKEAAVSETSLQIEKQSKTQSIKKRAAKGKRKPDEPDKLEDQAKQLDVTVHGEITDATQQPVSVEKFDVTVEKDATKDTKVKKTTKKVSKKEIDTTETDEDTLKSISDQEIVVSDIESSTITTEQLTEEEVTETVSDTKQLKKGIFILSSFVYIICCQQTHHMTTPQCDFI